MTETSPLLRARYSNGYNDLPPSVGIPAILPSITSLPLYATLTTSSLYHAVPFLQSLQRTEQVAWVLCALLYLYTDAAVSRWNSAHGTWERWKTLEDAKEGRKNIEKLIEATWHEFVEVWQDVENPARAGDAVEDVLWTSIPLDEGGKKWIRGIMDTKARWSTHIADATLQPLISPYYPMLLQVLFHIHLFWYLYQRHGKVALRSLLKMIPGGISTG